MSNLKLPYGLRKINDKKILVHISDVHPYESGLKCNCICPKCESPLQAKLPRTDPDFTPRFAHHNIVECRHATETAIHMKAKELIEKKIKILLPEVIACYGDYSKRVFDSKWVSFDKVILEKRTGSITPDIIGYIGDRKLYIEIKCTHGVDERKTDKIKKRDVSTLEIDLSNIETDFNEEDLRQQLFGNNDNKKWVYNTLQEKYQAEFKSRHLRKIAEIQREKEKHEALEKRVIIKKRERVKRIIEEIEKSDIKKKWERELSTNPIFTKVAKAMLLDADNMEKHLNIEIKGEIIFGCDRRVWQSYIYYKFIYNKVGLYGETTYPIKVERVQDNIEKVFKEYLIDELIDTKALNNNFPDLTRVIYNYLKSLEKLNYIEKISQKSMYNSEFEIIRDDSSNNENIKNNSDSQVFYDIRHIPKSLPEYYEIIDLLKRNNWSEISSPFLKIVQKYKNSNQYDIYRELRKVRDEYFKKFN